MMRSAVRLALWCAAVALALLPVAASAQSPGSAQATAPPQRTLAAQMEPSGAGPVRTLTREQAEALALKNNPQISVGRLNALVARQFVREQRAALLPTAALNATGVDAQPGGRIAAGGLSNSAIYSRAAAGANVSQLITDFGRTPNLVASANLQAKAQGETAAATTADIILAVDQSFFNTLETEALVTVAQQTVNARQTLVDKIQALTDAKLRSDLDLSFAKVDLARARLLLLEARNNYQASLAALSALLGFSDEQNLQLVEPPAAASTPPPLTVEPLIGEALAQRPEVLSLRDQVQSAEKFSHAEHDLKLPNVTALGSVGLVPARDNHVPSWWGAVGVNIDIPVFNGFLFDARARTADLQTSIDRQRLADLQNNIARDVRNAWQDSNRAFARLSVARQLEEQANLALDLAQSRYNLGLSSIVEFSQAELQKTEADISDTDARYQYQLTQIVLAYTVAAPR
jgi:outer membrane protein